MHQRNLEIDLDPLVYLRANEFKRRCFTIPIRPYHDLINQLITEYQTISQVPDSKAKSLFGPSQIGQSTAVSYRCCKYQLLFLIIREILRRADQSSTIAYQAQQYSDVLSSIIDALSSHDNLKFKHRLIAFGALVPLALCILFAIKANAHPEVRVSFSMAASALALIALISSIWSLTTWKHSHERQRQANEGIDRLQTLPLQRLESSSFSARYNVHITNLVTKADLDILRILDLLYREKPSCMIEGTDNCVNHKDNPLSENPRTETVASAADEKTIVSSDPLNSDQDTELYFIQTKGDEKNSENKYGGPYCACCISTHIQTQEAKGLKPTDPQSKNLIVFDHGRAILHPVSHILGQWERLLQSFPSLLGSLSLPKTLKPLASSTVDLPTADEKKESTIPIDVTSELETPLLPTKNPRPTTTRIPSHSSLLHFSTRTADRNSPTLSSRTEDEEEGENYTLL